MRFLSIAALCAVLTACASELRIPDTTGNPIVKCQPYSNCPDKTQK